MLVVYQLSRSIEPFFILMKIMTADEHQVLYGSDESLDRTPETDVTLCVN